MAPSAQEASQLCSFEPESSSYDLCINRFSLMENEMVSASKQKSQVEDRAASFVDHDFQFHLNRLQQHGQIYASFHHCVVGQQNFLCFLLPESCCLSPMNQRGRQLSRCGYSVVGVGYLSSHVHGDHYDFPGLDHCCVDEQVLWGRNPCRR